MDFFKMYDEVKKFESNHEKGQGNEKVSSDEQTTDRTEESDITEETKEDGKEKGNLETEEKEIESEVN